MRELSLSPNGTALVDDEDYEKVMAAGPWHFLKKNPYVVHSLWVNNGPATLYLHRFVTDAPAELHVDHINHNRSDNQKANLRVCTRSENLRNQVKRSRPASSQYKGVDWNSSRGKWRAVIGVLGHQRWLGRFDNEEDAARAYDAAATEIFGEFAHLNFEVHK